MERAGSSAKSVAESVSSPTALSEHCVQLTKQQYSALCDLRNDSLFKKALLSPSSSSHPAWEKLLASKKPLNQCLVWRVHHYWLGSLKFALLSRTVDAAEELYRNISTIYEDLLAKLDSDTTFFPPRTRRLVFDHVGRGVFRLRLAPCEMGEGKQTVVGGKFPGISEEECRRRVRVLASEAVHVTRSSPWPKYGQNFHDHVAGLPLALLEGDGAECSPEALDEASIGSESAAYRHELRRTVAYVAEQMEGRGERVDWDYLYLGAIAEDLNSPHNLLSALSKSVDDFIEDHLLHTVKNNAADVT